MFDNFTLLVNFILATTTYVWNSILNGWGAIGIFVLAMPILRKVFTLFRKILHS